MAMGRQGDRQGDLMVIWSEMPRSPGHVFYDRLQEVLLGAGFDGFVEEACRAFYARTMGAPSVPPGRYFRMHRVVARGWCVLILLPTADGAADGAILMVLVAHSAIPALIVVNMRLDRRSD